MQAGVPFGLIPVSISPAGQLPPGTADGGGAVQFGTPADENPVITCPLGQVKAVLLGVGAAEAVVVGVGEAKTQLGVVVALYTPPRDAHIPATVIAPEPEQPKMDTAVPTAYGGGTEVVRVTGITLCIVF